MSFYRRIPLLSQGDVFWLISLFVFSLEFKTGGKENCFISMKNPEASFK